MNNPYIKLACWIQEEDQSGNPFSRGAVLSTVSQNGIPQSRVVSTMLNDEVVKFHTSQASRKVKDITFNNTVSLTYSFQKSLRSISIEGVLTSLCINELDKDWMKFDSDFRKHYLISGDGSGSEIENIESLRVRFSNLADGEERYRPDSFIGYKFSEITRIIFYSVKNNDFASSTLFEKNLPESNWIEKTVIP